MEKDTSIRCSQALLDVLWLIKKDRHESNSDAIWRLLEEAGYDVDDLLKEAGYGDID